MKNADLLQLSSGRLFISHKNCRPLLICHRGCKTLSLPRTRRRSLSQVCSAHEERRTGPDELCRLSTCSRDCFYAQNTSPVQSQSYRSYIDYSWTLTIYVTFI
ncbi:hypothetical protein GDO81_016649 [Engystomops pustulosus]|uniref:Uncharacterized protein n=1 Tax=Engystomops pustulosus TaxID=76066 RepID=A0AAV7A819_ENGPU|nr:hypothetical protein GDO81_016649 [Engystomops pustulosus]